MIDHLTIRVPDMSARRRRSRRARAIVELYTGPPVTDGVEVGPLAPRQVDQQLRGGALLIGRPHR